LGRYRNRFLKAPAGVASTDANRLRDPAPMVERPDAKNQAFFRNFHLSGQTFFFALKLSSFDSKDEP
jgi:hypothetical protein